MIMASCLISTANGTSKSNPTSTFVNGNHKMNYHHSNHTNHANHRNSTIEFDDEINGDSNGDYRTGNGNANKASDSRVIKLRRVGNSPLGFSIRGGFEHGTGVFVSEVHPSSEAEREGLRPGDQILRVNGFSIEQAIHEEVIALIKSTSRITLKVKSVGLIPIRETQAKCVSWKYVDVSPSSTCPIHSRWPSKVTTIASTSPSPSSSRSSTSETDLFQNFSIAGHDFMEAKVFVCLPPGQGLGCSVVKGPSSYPGIYVQVLKKGGIAEESGLEVGDQIIGINGTSLEPGDIEFNEAIAMIKSCQQMTLTVRKKSGLNLFKNQKQKIKALIHSNPNDDLMAINHHLPLSSKQSSSSSSGSSENHRFFDPSEHDFSMSEVESNGNDQIVKIPRVNHGNWKQEKSDVSAPIAEANESNDNPIVSAKKMYEEVRKEEERLAEERKKLEAEQKRLQDELEKLEKERKQLENLKQDECKSISSSSTVSGSQSVSSCSSAASGSASGSGSQISFLDEIKKLAEKRNGENSLITDTLNKTKHLEKDINNGLHKTKHFGPDGDKRKRHELLMEEFRAAHSKMFGNQTKLKATQSSSTLSSTTATSVSSIPCPPPLPNEPKKQLIGQSKSVPPLPTFVNENGEKVTILKTTSSPVKKTPPPPVPVKKSSAPPVPMVTISSYENNQPPNRFLVNNDNNSNRSVITVGDNNERSIDRKPAMNGYADTSSAAAATGKSPHSIKINLQSSNFNKK